MLIVCIAALTGLLCFCSFTWGVSRHFRHDSAMPRGMRLLSYGSLAALLWFLVRLATDGPSPAWPLAIVLMLAALGLFWSAVHATRRQRLTLAFSSDAPMFLHRHGPYAYVRHPFYSAYSLFWIATSLSSPGVIQWLAPVALVWAYVHAARTEERKFANSPLATDYRLYQHSTGMLFPLLWRDARSWAIVRGGPAANPVDRWRRDRI
ncbi:methyltransferase family protein [Lichenicoccus sp.]|uniref:methyltransferase family protein n=1 Tax=Lichenicoccus sp. TaxID=2781899 RepID=UPI003D153192